MMLCPFPDDLGILLYPEICPILPFKSNTSNPNTSRKTDISWKTPLHQICYLRNER
jgi:hypothetical protein